MAPRAAFMGTNRLPSPARHGDLGERGVDHGLVPGRPDRFRAIDLGLLQRDVDREHVGRLALGIGEPVHAHHDLLTAVDRLGKAVRRPLDLVLHEPGLNGRHRSPQRIDAVEVLVGRLSTSSVRDSMK